MHVHARTHAHTQTHRLTESVEYITLETSSAEVKGGETEVDWTCVTNLRHKTCSEMLLRGEYWEKINGIQEDDATDAG